MSDTNATGGLPELYRHWYSLHGEPRGLLYHYTAADGPVGILRNRSVWATNVRWRAIRFDHEGLDVSIRTRSGLVIPYVELRVENEEKPEAAVAEIVYGPTLEKDQTERSVRMLVEASGYDARRGLGRSVDPPADQPTQSVLFPKCRSVRPRIPGNSLSERGARAAERTGP